MSVLEKILEEIEEKKEKALNVVKTEIDPMEIAIHREQYKGLRMAEDIIRKHIPENDGWIPVEEGLPKEHDSIFVKWKGTERWSDAMFEKRSDDVNVTVEYEDGTRNIITMHTLDGKWKYQNRIIQQKAIAWKPFPTPYRPKEEDDV